MDCNDYIQQAQQIKKQLYLTAFLYMGSEKAALDAVDEAIYKGFNNFKNLRNVEFFVTWMNRILINTCNTELKRQKRQTSLESLSELSSEEFDLLPLKEAISKLPQELRAVIILRFFTGLTLEKTATTLSIPRGTVTSRQKKALSLLKLDLS